MLYSVSVPRTCSGPSFRPVFLPIAMPNVVDLQRSEDPSDLVHRAVQVLAEGGIVGVPTDTVYAVVASGLSESAVERLKTLDIGSYKSQISGNGQPSKAAAGFSGGNGSGSASSSIAWMAISVSSS